MPEMGSIIYRVNPSVAAEDLNSLFTAAWAEHSWLDFDSELRVARDRRVEWLHVDFEPHPRNFYGQCGFRPTEAGLMHLSSGAQS